MILTADNTFSTSKLFETKKFQVFITTDAIGTYYQLSHYYSVLFSTKYKMSQDKKRIRTVVLKSKDFFYSLLKYEDNSRHR